MSDATNQRPPCRILEASPRETVTWTMPAATYDCVVAAMEGHQLLYGSGRRAPRATVERMLALLETVGLMPGIRDGVTVERKATEPAVRGHKASFTIHDDWVYRRWMAGPDAGWQQVHENLERFES